MTYGDGVTDVDLAREFDFHLKCGKIGTVLAINPPSRFGDLVTDGDVVTRFAEKPELSDNCEFAPILCGRGCTRAGTTQTTRSQLPS